MSILFTPRTIGNVLVKNRFVHSACEDNLADKTGAVTEANIQRVRSLARGEVGLMVWRSAVVLLFDLLGRFAGVRSLMMK